MNFIEIAGYISLVIGSGLAIYANNQNTKSKIKDENNKDLIQRVEILEKDREEAREQHLENQKAIANLEGQLKTYKDIPLQQIADSLRDLAKNQDAVLTRLNMNAEIAKKEAESGGVLVKSEESAPLAVKDVTK